MRRTHWPMAALAMVATVAVINAGCGGSGSSDGSSDGTSTNGTASSTDTASGRRYEAAIAFLLSQVDDFDVVERNLRTDTEELDAVVQQRTTQGRVWSGLGAPLILVEAKNWKEPVTQKEASAFRVKLDGRRGVVRLGLMFGASGFTSDALDQELRFASDELTIAFVRPEELDAWLRADDGGDDYIETLARRAMLR